MEKLKAMQAIGAVALLTTSSAIFANGLVDEVGAEYAIADIDDCEGSDLCDGGAIALKASKYLENVMPGLSVEAEFTKSISGFEDSETIGGTTYSAEISYYTLGGYGKYTLPVADQVSLFGRLGFVYTSVEAEVSGGGESYSDDDSDTDISFGVGGSFAISNKLKITAGYTTIDDLNHISFGVAMLLN